MVCFYMTRLKEPLLKRAKREKAKRPSVDYYGFYANRFLLNSLLSAFFMGTIFLTKRDLLFYFLALL